MTNPMINPQPNYSGVTIQISNPAVNVGRQNPEQYSTQIPNGYNTEGYYPVHDGNMIYGANNYSQYGIPYNAQGIRENAQNLVTGMPNNNGVGRTSYMTHPAYANPVYQDYSYQNVGRNISPTGEQAPQMNSYPYPPQYYLNNYNYQGDVKSEDVMKKLQEISDANNKNVGVAPAVVQSEETGNVASSQNPKYEEVMPYKPEAKAPEEPEDMSRSEGIINNLDVRDAASKAEAKNTTQKRVVALTDEYIKSLENYLNNPNDEIRLMASKEILKRLDEDKDRFDDAALNALLNKMLQDSSKLIRIAALSAFSSQLACGNDYTVQLLQNIQANPDADKEDVVEAADILLKMSAGTEMKNVPNPQTQPQVAPQETPQNIGEQ